MIAPSKPVFWARNRTLGTYGALAVILAVAAYTRLARLDLIDFKADEAQILELAQAVVAGKWPASSIPTSAGLFNPPLLVYVLAIPALFTRNPAWQAALIGFVDVLGVLATFAIGRRFFGARAGLAAAACYAADAYDAIFARKIAGPFLEPAAAAILLWCLLAAVCPAPAAGGGGGISVPKAWGWAGAVVAWGVLVQLHLATLLLGPVLLILFFAYGKRAHILPAAAGVLAVLAMFMPYVLNELRSQANFLSLLSSAAGGGKAGWDSESFRLIWTLISSPAYGDVTGAASALFNAQSWLAGWLTPLIGIATTGGLAVAIVRWRQPRYLALALFVLVPLLLTLHHTVDGLRIHYFVFLEPGLFLLAGIGLDWLLARVPLLAAPAGVVLGGLLLTQVLAFGHFVDFLQIHSVAGGYGLPLGYQQRVYEHAAALAGRDGRVLAASAGRDDSGPARYLLGGTPNVETDRDAGLLLPSRGGVYVTLSQQSPAARELATAFKPAYVEALPGGQDTAAVYALPANAVKSLGLTPTPSGRWQNDVTLLGVSAPRALPGQLAAAFQVMGAVDPSTILFSQLVDDAGKQWFDRDSAPADPSAWQPGDVVVSLTAGVLPPGAPRQEYWWSLGMYEHGGRRVPLDDGQSQLRAARLKGGVPAAEPSLTPSGAVFGGLIRLDGYRLQPDGVTLSWHCLAPITRDYTVFVHVLDAAGSVTAQKDSQPEAGRYPTSLWDPGETIVDHVALPVPAGARVELGLYDLASGRRLPVHGGDHVVIGG